MSNACCFLWQKLALLATWTAFMMQIAIAFCCNSKATQLPKRGSGVLQFSVSGQVCNTDSANLFCFLSSPRIKRLTWFEFPRGELRIATTASCCCYCHVCFLQVRVWPSVTRSNHSVVYAPLSFSSPFLSVSVLIALSDWDVSLMRSVCSCSCFGCCFGDSGLPPPFFFCFCGVSSTWYYFW